MPDQPNPNPVQRHRPVKSALLVGAVVVLSIAASRWSLLNAGSINQERCRRELRLVSDTPYRQLPIDELRQAWACFNRFDKEERAAAMAFVEADLSRLAMLHAMIPEYHDEQRLTDGAGGVGPKAHIYASPSLAGFRRHWQFSEHGDTGVLVAHVVVTLEPGETSLPNTYRSLNLRPGMNCVWLVHRPPNPNHWDAYIRPETTPKKTCDPGVPPGTYPITVVRTQEPGTTLSDYPPVARFGETQTGEPTLGIACLDGFCEIGAGTFTPRQSLSYTLGPRPFTTIKGWHDEQMLTIRDPITLKFVPLVRAVIVPEPGVELLSPNDFNTPKHTATIYLATDPPTWSKYYRWGLRGAYVPNQIWIHRSGNNWDVTMLRQGIRHNWRINDREWHIDAAVPGTARFRWTYGDDGIWTPCGGACCEVEG